MNKILVTGGSGFIGTNLIDSLERQQKEIVNIDISPPINKKQLPYWKKIDILDYKNLETEIINFDPAVIIHLAATTDLNGTNIDYYKTNIEGTKNIISIAEKASALKKVIYTSSMYVCRPGFIPRNYDTYQPHTLYGESKVQSELLVKAIRNPKYKWVIVRPTSIWGPWFNVPYVDFFNVVYQGKYFDFGKACTKTYGYVGNTILQIDKLIHSDQVHSKTFYLGDDPPIQISEWANEISIELGKGKIKKIPYTLLRTAAVVGDILGLLKIRFPITNFRLKNMTTDNILPLKDLYEITGSSEINRTEGVKNTIQWLIAQYGYRLQLSK